MQRYYLQEKPLAEGERVLSFLDFSGEAKVTWMFTVTATRVPLTLGKGKQAGIMSETSTFADYSHQRKLKNIQLHCSATDEFL